MLPNLAGDAVSYAHFSVCIRAKGNVFFTTLALLSGEELSPVQHTLALSKALQSMAVGEFLFIPAQ